ncbi:hypothetical protein [Salegentibacter sp. Hel_I_6]|uniref:PIN-like domain-containing protein n=1 Tax=Salegentibacter sp. Hel_I_6 TaxID=1250278 RepID=UPI00056CB182|nr:hypothetical protein [Salegentibacter sp. Hel_I_6]
MKIYLDENMPRHLAEGFHTLQYPEGFKKKQLIEVRYIPTIYGAGVKDVDWIPKVGKERACVITQDVNIHRRKHELELYNKNKIGMFFLRGPSKKQGLSIWQMVEALAKNWPEISEKVHQEKRPFAYTFGLKGKLKKI